MRIIGGDYARLRFIPPKGLKLRPTTDLAKEALFSALGSLISLEGKRVLDLFSGTGSIGIEFVSRRAEEVVFVEKNPKHARYIQSIIKELRPSSTTQVVVQDTFKYIAKCEQTFDLIFADPPYDLPTINDLPGLVLGSSLLAPEGYFVLEHPSSLQFIDTYPACFKHKSYSEVTFSFFRNV